MLRRQLISLVIDPDDPDRLYAACGLYLTDWVRKAAWLSSTDRGANWQINELGITLAGNGSGRGSGERLQVDPNKGDILLLGTSQDGLMKSTDRGKTFNPLSFPAKHVSLVLFDPRSGTPGKTSASIYIGSHDKPGLYVSQDGGVNFAREPGTPEQAPQRAEFGPDGSLYAGPKVTKSSSPATTGRSGLHCAHARSTTRVPIPG